MLRGFWGAFFLSLVVLGAIMAITVTMVQPIVESPAESSATEAYEYHPIGSDALSLLVMVEDSDHRPLECVFLRFVPEKGQVPLTFLPVQTLLQDETGLSVMLSDVYTQQGITALKSSLEEQLGVPVERYAVLSKEAFLSLCAKTGTVTTDLPEDVRYTTAERTVHLAAGVQKLDGQGIWELAGEPYALHEIPDRSRRLGNLAAEFINQNLDAASEDRAQRLFTLAVNQIETDLTFTDFALRTQALDFVSRLEGVNVAGCIPVSGEAELEGFRLSEEFLEQLQSYF